VLQAGEIAGRVASWSQLCGHNLLAELVEEAA
jgi:hypothetical protein